jgi:hypothetical protein
MDLYDNGTILNITNPNHIPKMITFVRAFRDFARQAGERPSGAIADHYMGNNRMHLDIADGNTTSVFPFHSYRWPSGGGGVATEAWMYAIMYGNRPDDGLTDASGNIIGDI